MPKRSDDYMADRRRQILEATIACINDQGWNRTTVDDVARAAGLSKGAVYIHFANKRALLVGLLEMNIAQIEARAGIDSFEAFREDLLSGLEILDGERGWLLCVGQLEAQVEGIRDPEIRAMLNQAADRLIEVFATIVERLRPEISPPRARSLALSLILVMDGMRSFRTISEGLSATAMRAVIDRQLRPLNPKLTGQGQE
jgi:AcrR family transcriptional regulator